jgi:RNA polymerase sigma factor (sigma-70 family)
MMEAMDDMALLREYAVHHSEAAFETLVFRWVNFVHSAAIRQVQNPHLAEEVTQAVFLILAQKAGRISEKTILSGWLFKTTRFAALAQIRAAAKRSSRTAAIEKEFQMQNEFQSTATDEMWNQMSPLLDEALAALGEKDRQAVLLRFFENKSLAEVGNTLGAGEDTARKRVTRAVEKLRKYFSKHGITSTTAIIGETVSTHSVQAAPMALAKAVAAIAVTKGTAASFSTLIVIKGALKIMAWAKAKTAVVAGAVILLAGSVVTMTVVNSNPTDDERYLINGDLVYQTPKRDVLRNFTLTVNGDNWAIHITGQEPQSGIKYEDEVCLNGSVYKYSYFGKPGSGSSVKNSGGAVIEYGESAIEDGTFANFVWVGLASGYYFSQTTNDEITPMYQTLDRNERVKAQWQRYDTAPYLPKSIDYYHKPIQGIVLRPGVILHGFDNGWKSGEFRVLQETNINGRTFPTIFTYEQFSPKINDPASSNKVEHQYLVTVNVRTIRLKSVPYIRPPKTEGTTAVTDRRMLSKQAVPQRSPPGLFEQQSLYFSTADFLPEKPDVEAIKKTQEESHTIMAIRHPFESEELSNRKWIWLPVILIVSAVATIAGLTRRNRKQ